ncbi:MAG: adenylate/guanylate cyclase domain-containing protein [Proteobacteria bacterium]|nr:adenylate/guanylate cyclase domain-containing protein [Pseudomonadota bacterium]
MPSSLVFSDVAFRQQRSERARMTLTVGQALIAGAAGFWVLHGLSLQNWVFAGVEGLVAASGAALLFVTRRVPLALAGHLTFWVTFACIWLMLLSLEGVQGPGSSFNQVWFLTLAVGACVVLIEVRRSVAVCYVALCAASFLAAQLGWITADPVAPLPAELAGPGRGVGMLLHAFAMLVLVRAIVEDVRRGEHALAESASRIQALLDNVLPATVSARLRRDGTTFADKHEACSVLFADIVGFTPLASATPPDALVRLLDEVFSTFDDLAESLGLEKIKTIGDAYMAASGLPEARADHAIVLVEFALRMREAVAAYPRLSIRIGINSGQVVAGLIGKQRLAYDLWGDTVNIAAHMESHGIAGEIQVSAATHALIAEQFACDAGGEVAVAGRPPLHVYRVSGRRREGAHG